MTGMQMVLFLIINSFLSVVVNLIQGFSLADTLVGMAVLLGIVFVGYLIYRAIPWKGLPAVAYIVTLGCIVTIPGLIPGSEFITAATSKISFIGLCTPILAYAGLALGKDMGLLKKQGWRIVVVGLVVFVGTFVGSAVIAETILRCIK